MSEYVTERRGREEPTNHFSLLRELLLSAAWSQQKVLRSDRVRTRVQSSLARVDIVILAQVLRT